MKQIYIKIGSGLGVDRPRLIYNPDTDTWYVHAMVPDEQLLDDSKSDINPKDCMCRDGKPVHTFMGIDPFVVEESPIGYA
jgi:hypothetical protein